MTSTPGATSVSVDGLRKLQRALRATGDGLADLKDANAKASGVVVDEAERHAPRRTGRLAASGRAARAAGRASVLFGGARVPYAAPIHYGWPGHHIEAQPFVLEAAEATRDTWLAAYEADLQRLVDRAGGTF